MSSMSGPVIGVDVGASTIAAGLVRADDGVVLDTVQSATGDGDVVEAVTALVEQVLARAARRGETVAGIGIGLPGLVDVEKGYMRSIQGAWLSELGDVPLASIVRERTGHRVYVDNDVNALALAEWMFGAGRGAASLVTLAIGTGMGAGVIQDGVLVRGHAAAAGEIGHLAVNLTGHRCQCGAVACLGTYVAGGFLPERVRERLPRYPSSAVLVRAGGDTAAITPESVFAEAAAGDPLARELVDEACEALAMGIGALVSLLNPEVIVITGGVASSLLPLREDIISRARRRTLATVLDATTLRIVPTDKRATVRGGAALVRYETARRGAEA